jgi:hypothetical protein
MQLDEMSPVDFPMEEDSLLSLLFNGAVSVGTVQRQYGAVGGMRTCRQFRAQSYTGYKLRSPINKVATVAGK